MKSQRYTSETEAGGKNYLRICLFDNSIVPHGSQVVEVIVRNHKAVPVGVVIITKQQSLKNENKWEEMKKQKNL